MGRKPKNQINQTENKDQPIIEEENLVKKTCRELGITQKELAERIGYGYSTIKAVASDGTMSEAIQKALELLLTNYQLEQKLSESTEFKIKLKAFIS